MDETGWRDGGRLKWLWVNATRDVTAFEVLDERSTAAAQRVISPEAQGVVTTDRYWSYNWLAGRRRQVCWAHLSRDFQAMVERGGESEEIGGALLKQAGRLFALWHRAREGGLSRERLQTSMRLVQRRMKALLEAGARCGQKKT